ncbi:AraC family transcriptional regulator [Comamonas testosteroni]|uniref:AraC family transcriptional regulator n=1 Tax=Comamonas testosteroni TaxID=285 RepID=A0A0L7MR38_COMTE|nr:helix-turn-helix transcriptional regulator [Comamonas testosteroni]KOC24391.1 AraC family transcriptional regulator [Comamonas testosteroni]KWT67576.1 Transcriptional regulator, AraC family [Comamonas testosteroni]
MQQYGPKKHLDFHNHPRPLVAMENRWAAGTSTGWHSHPRGQLLYATEGVMVIHSNAGSWVVPPNRALWMVAGLRHSVTMSGNVLMRTAYVDEAAIKRLPKESCVINVSPLLRELLVEAVRLPVAGVLSPRDKRLIGLLIDELRVSSTVALHLPMPSNDRLRPICNALIERPDDQASATEWAQTIGVGERTLQRLFAKGVGMTFSQWREQARLLAALTAIAQGRKVIDVAMDCGYSSHSAFTAMFRRHFGAPPSAFYQ